MMRYAVMIRRTNTGYSVDVPDVPGCAATARTVEHAREMIARALKDHLELLTEQGDPIPMPSRSIQFTFDEDSGEALCTWVHVDIAEAVET